MSQETSKTAVVATIAAELRGVPGDDQPAWFRTELGVDIGAKGRKNALRRRKQLSPFDNKKGPKSTGTKIAVEPDGWIWDTVGVDLHSLDLERALVVFEPTTQADRLIERLRQTIGVVEILESYGNASQRRVIARVIYAGAQRRAQLDDNLSGSGISFDWWSIRREVPTRPFESAPAAATWAALARQIAQAEGHAS